MRSFRIGAVAVALVLTSVASAGCSGSPDTASVAPTPMFASDEEAFAAAEATYRAYVDALNAYNADRSSRPRPTDFLSNPLYRQDLEYSRFLESQGKTTSGHLTFRDFKLINVEPQAVAASVCLDVTSSRTISQSGEDLTPTDRDDVVPLKLVFVQSKRGLLMSESLGYPEGLTCSG